MKKLVLLMFCFLTAFFSLYQKQQIILLAYEINNQKQEIDYISEKKSILLTSFLKETNIASISKIMTDSGIKTQYPKAQIKLAMAMPRIEEESEPTFLSRVFALTARAATNQ